MSFSMSPFPLRFGSRQGGGPVIYPPLYQEDFATEDDLPNWTRGLDSVDGTLAVVGGVLTYTKGAGDGDTPRMVRAITGFVIGATYSNSFVRSGTANDKRFYLSHDPTGVGTGATADTAPSPQEFTATQETYYATMIIVFGAAGVTIGIDDVLVERT